MFACGLKSELKLAFLSAQSCQGGDTVCIAKILPFLKASYLTLMADHAVQQTELKHRTVATNLSATVKAHSEDSPMIKKRPAPKPK